MPSALLAPANILQSFPTPLGRRGTVAVAVIGLHLLFASALIAGMVVTVTQKKDEEKLIFIPLAPPKVVPPPPIRTQPFTTESFGPRIVDEPATDIPTFVGPSSDTAPQPAVERTAGTQAIEPLSPPRVLKQLDPLYPAADRRAEHEGTVVVRVLIGEDGRAQQVEVAGSSGYPGLDAAAVASVQRWTFAPARNGGGPVAGWASVKVRFQIDRS